MGIRRTPLLRSLARKCCACDPCRATIGLFTHFAQQPSTADDLRDRRVRLHRRGLHRLDEEMRLPRRFRRAPLRSRLNGCRHQLITPKQPHAFDGSAIVDDYRLLAQRRNAGRWRSAEALRRFWKTVRMEGSSTNSRKRSYIAMFSSSAFALAAHASASVAGRSNS